MVQAKMLYFKANFCSIFPFHQLLHRFLYMYYFMWFSGKQWNNKLFEAMSPYNSYEYSSPPLSVFSVTWLSTMLQKQMILFLTNCQKVNTSLTLPQCLCHSPHFISSCRHCVISHNHKKKGEYCTIRDFDKETGRGEREREREITLFTIVYYYNCPILLFIMVVNLSLCLTYKLNFIIGMHV